MKKNLQLCVDLKTFLVNDPLPVLGRGYHGTLNQQKDDLVCFVEEELPKRGPKNKPVYKGRYLAVSYSRRLDRYWWRFINDNMPPVSIVDLNRELQLAKKAVTKHRKENGFVDINKSVKVTQSQSVNPL